MIYRMKNLKQRCDITCDIINDYSKQTQKMCSGNNHKQDDDENRHIWAILNFFQVFAFTHVSMLHAWDCEEAEIIAWRIWSILLLAKFSFQTHLVDSTNVHWVLNIKKDWNPLRCSHVTMITIKRGNGVRW